MKRMLTQLLSSVALVANAQLPVYQWAGLMPATVNFPNAIFEIETDAVGNIYSTGCFAFSIDMDPSSNDYLLEGVLDVFVQKLGADGQFKWACKIGGEDREGVMTAAFAFPEGDGGLCVTPNGSLYVANMTTSDSLDLDPGPGVVMYCKAPNQNYTKWDAFIVKLDSNGVFQWGHGFGGSLNERIVKLRLDAGGNVIALGAFSGTVDFDPGIGEAILTSSTESAFILSLSADGEFNWVKQLVASERVFGTGMDIDGNGMIHIVGTYKDTVDLDPGAGEYLVYSGDDMDNQGQSTFVLRLNNIGEFISVMSFTAFGGADTQILGGPLTPTISVSNGGVELVTGRYNGTVDFDPNGNSLQLTSIQGPNDPDNPFILKINSNNSVDWVGQLSTGVRIGDAVMDDSGRIYIVGKGGLGFEEMSPSIDTDLIEFSGSGGEGFISCINSVGNLEWVKLLGDPSFNVTSYGTALFVQGIENIYFGGLLGGGMDVDPIESQNVILTNEAEYGSLYLVKWTLDTSIWVSSTEIMESIKLWPNPTSGSWSVHLPNRGENHTTRLWSLHGELIFEREHHNQSIREDCNVASGVYLYQIIGETDSYSTLVVIE